MRTSRSTGDRGRGHMWSEFVGSHAPDPATGPGVLRCAMGSTRQGPLCREETIEGLVARPLIDPGSSLHAQGSPSKQPHRLHQCPVPSTSSVHANRRSRIPPLPQKGPHCTLGAAHLHSPLLQCLLLCPLPLHLSCVHVAKLLQGGLVLPLQEEDLGPHPVQGHTLFLLQQAPLIQQGSSQLLLPRESTGHCTPPTLSQHSHHGTKGIRPTLQGAPGGLTCPAGPQTGQCSPIYCDSIVSGQIHTSYS